MVYFPDRSRTGDGGMPVDDECTTLICDVHFSVNWVGVLAILLTAVAIALVARMWSGSFDAPWAGHRPPIWFLVVIVLPPLGLALFVVGAVQQLRAEGVRKGDVDVRP
jgi:hypothetical protein